MNIKTRSLMAALLAATLLSGCTAEADVSDCDAGDRIKQETPDCGFKHKGRYTEWSWVKDGKTTPPAGWSASKEKKSVTAKRKTTR